MTISVSTTSFLSFLAILLLITVISYVLSNRSLNANFIVETRGLLYTPLILIKLHFLLVINTDSKIRGNCRYFLNLLTNTNPSSSLIYKRITELISNNLSEIKKIELPPRAMETLFGVHDANIKYLESILAVRVNTRGQDLSIDGEPDDVQVVQNILRDFGQLFADGNTFTDTELRSAFKQIAEDRAYSLKDYFTKARFNPSGKKQVAPKTANQRKYIEAIQSKDLTFGIGPAGTGKSFLAVALGVHALFQKKVSRIILTRPAIEAGERLGFLPGDLQDKVDPYLRPLYDALFDLVDAERVTKMLEKHIIEIAPLAFMRGRTLADAFIILDEAQNTTAEQMKMFLTRIGFGSKTVVTGDKTQIDLPRGQKSGLVEVQSILKDLDEIEFVYFNDKDVVRHKLVQMIVKAYESHSESNENL